MSVNLGTVYASVELRLDKLKTGVREGQRELKGFEASLEKLAANTQRIGQKMSLALTAPILLIGKQAIKTAADYDSLRRSLIVTMGSAEAAGREFKKLQEAAKTPGVSFKEAVEGSVRLQAAGISADLARRAVVGLGNALASVGKSREDLQAVLYNLGQMASMGKLTGDELRETASRLPQFGKIIKEAFGTTDTAAIAKRGIPISEILEKLVEGLERLPRAAAGPRVEMEKFSEAMERLNESIGKALLPTLTRWMEALSPKIQAATDWFNRLEPAAQDAFAGVATALAATGPAMMALSGFLGLMEKLAGNVAFRALFIPGAVAAGGAYAFNKLDQGGFFDWLSKILPGGQGTSGLVSSSRRVSPAFIGPSGGMLAGVGLGIETGTSPLKRDGGSTTPSPPDAAAIARARRIAELNRQAQYDLADPVKQAYMDMAKNLSEGMSRSNAKGLFRKQLNEILEDLNKESLDISKRDGGLLTNIMLGDGSLSPQFQTTLRKAITQMRAYIAPMLDLGTDRMWELRSEREGKGQAETNFLGMIQSMEGSLGNAAALGTANAKGRDITGVMNTKDIGSALAQAAQQAKSEVNRFTFPLGAELGSNLALEMGREFGNSFDKIFGTGNPLTRALSRTLSRLVDDLMMALAQRAIGSKLILSLFGGGAAGAAGGLAGAGTGAAAGIGSGELMGGAAAGAKAAGLSAGMAWTAGFGIAAAWGMSRILNSIFPGTPEGKARFKKYGAKSFGMAFSGMMPAALTGRPGGSPIINFYGSHFANNQDPRRVASSIAWHTDQQMRARPGSG